ncbi:interferon omega-1-like [Leopardus geoffroyi]|uniref:interferon omega-1-like n=1 Tax=Leopardus geoffroyi TaxID=46844 RepID=UPI001E2600EE|nr:interferon omega-1-like [Leopardus geoffroyi]
MALLRPLLTALALLTCRPGGSLGCALPGSQAQVSRDNLVLLGQMRRLSPFSCLRARKDFRFPREMLEGGQLREAQAAAAVLRELLQQTFNLLHTERSSAAWSPAPLHGLRSGLHRQLEALDACLVTPQERVGVGEGRKATFPSLILALDHGQQGTNFPVRVLFSHSVNWVPLFPFKFNT